VIKLCACLALCLVACGYRYTTIGESLRLNTLKAGGNRCSVRAGPTVRAAWAALKHHSQRLGMQTRWPPPKPVAVCVVEMTPYVACANWPKPKAGCAWPMQVYVAMQWAPPPHHDRLDRSYSWQATLVHELIGALTLQGVLSLPLPEPAMVSDPRYSKLKTAVQGDLP
jgi:hypothetical protein